MPQFLFAPRVNSFDNEETVMGTYTGVQWQNAVTVPTMELVFFFVFFYTISLNLGDQIWTKKCSYCILLLHNTIYVDVF